MPISGIDLLKEECGERLVEGLKENGVKELDLVIFSAGYFTRDVSFARIRQEGESLTVFCGQTLAELSWKEHQKMYTLCSIGAYSPKKRNQISEADPATTAPQFVASALLKANLYAKNAKFLMITTEGGSIALRTQEEGGGNYAHHGSKVRPRIIRVRKSC